METAIRPRVLIVDDAEDVRKLLGMMLQSEGIDVVAEASDGAQGTELALEQDVDCVVMDLRMPVMGGIEATRRIKESSPATKVVVMTAHEDERLLVDAVEAGASGFLRKTEGVDEFLGALKAAAAGEILIDRTALARLLPRVAREREARRDAQILLDQLTDREQEILNLLAKGLRNEDIASMLFISPQTVQTHVRNLLGKLGVHSKLEAVAFAVRHGAVEV
jgi:DNA-binding NarL/FixJ family response regulator